MGNPGDPPEEDRAGAVPRLPDSSPPNTWGRGGWYPHLPKLPKRPDAQHTRTSTAHTKPTCCGSISLRPRTLRRRGVPRSAIAAPGCRPWERTDGELQGAERCLWPSCAGAGTGAAQLSRERFRAKASWTVSKVGGERGLANRQSWWRRPRGRSSESRAWRARSAHHGSVARRRRRHGGAGGPGLQAWRSPGAGAATCPLRGAGGSTQCAPAPRAPAPTRSILLALLRRRRRLQV